MESNLSLNFNKFSFDWPDELESFKYKYRMPRKINLCKTNKTRILINDYMMNKKDYFISKNKLNNV